MKLDLYPKNKEETPPSSEIAPSSFEAVDLIFEEADREMEEKTRSLEGIEMRKKMTWEKRRKLQRRIFLLFILVFLAYTAVRAGREAVERIREIRDGVVEEYREGYGEESDNEVESAIKEVLTPDEVEELLKLENAGSIIRALSGDYEELEGIISEEKAERIREILEGIEEESQDSQ